MSYAHDTKSMNCISATGRMPMWAAPAAAPTIAASEIGVALAAVRLDLEELDTHPGAGALHGELRRLVHGEHVVTVHGRGRDPVSLRLVREVLDRELLLGRRGVRPAIVLGDHHQRTALHRREVQPFVKRPGGGAAVPDVDEPHAGLPAQFE